MYIKVLIAIWNKLKWHLQTSKVWNRFIPLHTVVSTVYYVENRRRWYINIYSCITCVIFVPRLFEEKRRDTVFGVPWCVARGAWCVVRGAWFRIFSRYLVPWTPPTVFVRSFWNLTPPTVFGRSFWKFTWALRMAWRYACGFFRILK